MMIMFITIMAVLRVFLVVIAPSPPARNTGRTNTGATRYFKLSGGARARRCIQCVNKAIDGQEVVENSV